MAEAGPSAPPPRDDDVTASAQSRAGPAPRGGAAAGAAPCCTAGVLRGRERDGTGRGRGCWPSERGEPPRPAATSGPRRARKPRGAVQALLTLACVVVPADGERLAVGRNNNNASAAAGWGPALLPAAAAAPPAARGWAVVLAELEPAVVLGVNEDPPRVEAADGPAGADLGSAEPKSAASDPPQALVDAVAAAVETAGDQGYYAVCHEALALYGEHSGEHPTDALVREVDRLVRAELARRQGTGGAALQAGLNASGAAHASVDVKVGDGSAFMDDMLVVFSQEMAHTEAEAFESAVPVEPEISAEERNRQRQEEIRARLAAQRAKTEAAQRRQQAAQELEERARQAREERERAREAELAAALEACDEDDEECRRAATPTFMQSLLGNLGNSFFTDPAAIRGGP